MAEIDLIHAGIPWNNPQKITVKADQYISQLVINRGLLNLLSNDYYLDLKTQRINQYIVQLFGPHIADTSIHWTEDGIKDVVKRVLNEDLGDDGFGLVRDTAFVIPIIPGELPPKNINRIQNIINNCPKNLNGHTAIFALTPVVSGNYNTTIGEYYNNNKSVISSATYETENFISTSGCYDQMTVISANNKSIMLNNFYGGSLIFLGNDFFTCEEKYQDGGKSLNTRQTRIFLQQIQKNIDKTISSPLITIKGNGENNNRAVVSFNNCNCDSYIWNLNVTLDDTIVSNKQTVDDTPSKKQLSLFFPANTFDDMLTGNVRYIVADSINDQNFTQSYITLRSKQQTISGGLTEYWEKENDNYKLTSAINLNNDYLMLSSSYDKFIQTFFGQYINNDEIVADSLYEGATLCFWMKQNFYSKNINEVPIIYSLDSEGNGFYFGLDKIANINHNEIDVTQYLDTTFASKKRTDFNSTQNIAWNYWAIQIQPVDLNLNHYLVNVYYCNPLTSQIISIIPSKTANSNTNLGIEPNVRMNQITFNHLNMNTPISFFGTPDIRSEAWIRNITLFNSVLSESELAALAKQGLANAYNLDEIETSQTFRNGMKGALYVYNTTSMNVLGCKLAKVGSN